MRHNSTICRCSSLPPVLGIDCEMCETIDPVTGIKNPSSLVRLSVVNGINPKEVRHDTYGFDEVNIYG